MSVNDVYENTQGSFIANSPTLETQMSNNRRMRHKLSYIHTVEYYTATKKSKLLTHPKMWTNRTDME